MEVVDTLHHAHPESTKQRRTCFGRSLNLPFLTFAMAMLFVIAQASLNPANADELSDEQMKAVLALEKQRVKAIDRVIGSVIAIYGSDRSGGGSGVIIHPSGIALTNHHVIMGAGVEGWGGIADGKMYKWKLIGTDPGGDVSIIQMEGRDDFPWTPLGDSDIVRVGDWALAMGNPFILTEDQTPTVTLGIVSGVKRYQEGAGQNQLVYGNCIQVDSSINPGNSGGPLFNFQGEVIGINGRGSFRDRGRVNVGLGYAISSNQIRNFIPELLATKLVEHATLDANFANRKGKVVCSDLNLDAPVAEAGLKLGDELLEFEGVEIKTANQFTNLICTIPEDWPISLKVRDKEGKEKSICVRAFGLPYAKPKKKKSRKPDKDKTPEEKAQEKQQNAMIELLAAPPGEVRYPEINQKYAELVLDEWRQRHISSKAKAGCWKLESELKQVTDGVNNKLGKESLTIYHDGRFHLESTFEEERHYIFDGTRFFLAKDDEFQELTVVEAKTNSWLMAAYGVAAPLQEKSFRALGGVPFIDGSDKTAESVAWRLRVDDEDDDPTFVWLDYNREYGECETVKMLRKISASLESDEGSVLFKDYEMNDGLAIPSLRLLVDGLQEDVRYRIITNTSKWVEEADTSIFDKLPKKEEPKEPPKKEGDMDKKSDKEADDGDQKEAEKKEDSEEEADAEPSDPNESEKKENGK